MKTTNKKAQEIFGISFNVLFSIFLIIFIIAVAFFVIKHFVGLSKCTNVGLFYDDLREEVRDAWSSSSGRYEADYPAKIPKKGLFGTGIEYICFGTLASQFSDDVSRDIQKKLIEEYLFDESGDYNVFAYPPDKGCDTGMGAIVLKCGSASCVSTKLGGTGASQFFCQPVSDDGTVTVKMTKQSDQYQITLQKVL
jgi:hypothetical protein